MPLQSAYCWQPQLAKAIDELVQTVPFDIVHVEHLRGARYGLRAKAAAAQRGALAAHIWDSVDCISYLFQQAVEKSSTLKVRLMTRLDLQRTREYEGWLTEQFDRVLVTAENDKQALAELVRNRQLRSWKVGETASLDRHGKHDPNDVDHYHIEVISNGVDLQYFLPQTGIQGEADIVFTGKMSYHANITSARYLVQEVMPLVWAQRPDARIWIVGKEPPPDLCALASDSNGTKRVTITGTVPDVRPYLQRATVAVAPILYGAGVQNKVLEAMACGAPIVVSPQAISGLQAEAEDSVMIAQGAQAFADAILHIFQDSACRSRLSLQGRRYVEQQHSWQKIADGLEATYQEAVYEKQRQEQGQRL
jgi:glycosyltransferase involved in cell wall biosynthesis